MQEGLPTFSCPAHIVFVRCEQNAITMQRGLFSIWEQPFLAFWVIESVVLAVFQLCALKLGLSRTLKVRVECDTALVNLPSGVDAQ